MHNSKTLGELELHDGSGVVLVRVQPYNGRYKVEVQWNGTANLEVLGSHAKVTWGSEGFEAEITWDPEDHRKGTFKGRRFITTEWAGINTENKHTKEEGVSETFSMVFEDDSAEAGFQGSFQRTYEGPLSMKGIYDGEIDA
eukprot:CAMPEP_0168461402 /NCGR_PEP_ID=MMETSP0228-20121227/53965_1 /TAXON_ID=133427 /ORGANISM="Protoceratium reticulatum, Strain CCCM 535 (=CCMP 1889)" /LENGTH=140 /DNA_ID=CAMNT_0008476713 /DNA_START=1 /DNA_END=423 /DNA_ORIENTATION=+